VAVVDGDELDLRAVVVSLDGHRAVRSRDRAPLAEAAALGARLAQHLVAGGADAILEEVRRLQSDRRST
jgi:hydroxymethylbilane synthase